jgi:hypothetical protein
VPVLFAAGLARAAAAAPPWVDRALVQPYGVWAFDFGLGIGHEPNLTGPGFNFELAAGATRSLELGVRGGLRFGAEGRATRADQYGRLFDTETFGTGFEDVANPEVRLRYAVARGPVVELGLEGRAYLPVENGTRFGMMFGLPLALHLGGAARLDTGVFVPVLFHDPARTVVSIPIQLWFQTSNRFWLGPLSAIRLHNDPGSFTQVLLGFGLGYQMARQADFKAQLLFPFINGAPDQGTGARSFGVGAGIQIRIE